MGSVNSGTSTEQPSIVHKGFAYAPASAAQRRWARFIDGVLIVVIIAVVAGAAAGLSEPYDAIGAAGVMVILLYPLLTMVFGLLYGWGIGIGQLITRCKSRRTRDGRRVGGFRGWMRYWGIAFLPLAIYALFDAPTFWEDSIRVYQREGRRLPAGVGSDVPFVQSDPARDARFAQPDPYQNEYPYQQPNPYPPQPGQYPPQ